MTKLKDQSWKSIVPKSCSDYKDYFTLDNPLLAEKIYRSSTASTLYVLEVPNKPSGR